MTPDERDFLERHIPIWSARAAERRAECGRLAVNIALGLEGVVAGLRARLALANEVAKIEMHIANNTPYRDENGVLQNDGPLSRALRQGYSRRLAIVLGRPEPQGLTDIIPSAPPVRAALPVPLPDVAPPAPEPFAMGPQLGLFG